MDARGRRIHATIHHPFSLGPLGSSSIRLTGRLGLDSSPEAYLESFDRYEVLNAIGFCSSICKVSFKYIISYICLPSMEGLGLWDGPFLTRSVSIAFARLAMVDRF